MIAYILPMLRRETHHVQSWKTHLEDVWGGNAALPEFKILRSSQQRAACPAG